MARHNTFDMDVAVKVLGWIRGQGWGNGNGEWIINGKSYEQHRISWGNTPKFSSDMNRAMEVVEKVAAPGIHFMSDYLVQHNGKKRWFAQFLRDGLTDGLHNEWIEAETLPMAICLAALAAIAGEGGDKDD